MKRRTRHHLFSYAQRARVDVRWQLTPVSCPMIDWQGIEEPGDYLGSLHRQVTLAGKPDVIIFDNDYDLYADYGLEDQTNTVFTPKRLLRHWGFDIDHIGHLIDTGNYQSIWLLETVVASCFYPNTENFSRENLLKGWNRFADRGLNWQQDICYLDQVSSHSDPR